MYRKLKVLYRETISLKKAFQKTLIRHERTDQEVVQAWEGKIPLKKIREIDCTLTSKQRNLLNKGSESNNFFQKVWRHQRLLLHPDLADSYETLNQLLKNQNPKEILKWIGQSGVLSRVIHGNELKQAVESFQPILFYGDQINVCRLLKMAIEAKFNLDDGSVFLYTGDTTNENKRMHIIDRFKAAPSNKPRIMVLSKNAGGVGLDLNVKHVFIMERQFQPFEDKQLEDRRVRANQTGQVQIWYPFSNTELVLCKESFEYYF